MRKEKKPMEDLLIQALKLASEGGAEILDLLDRLIESTEEHDDESMTIDPEIVYEARNFLAEFRDEERSEWLN